LTVTKQQKQQRAAATTTTKTENFQLERKRAGMPFDQNSKLLFEQSNELGQCYIAYM
jgi:hypothetical protein